MKFRIKVLSAFIWLMPAMLFAADYVYQPVAVAPPAVPREFRGAWIAVVASNQDWPSEPGLPVAQQKAELISLLDRAAQLHFNAIILQIRPSCDALYASPIEPWSERLTGTMGVAPQPFYDPLAFAIQEAHKRGLELHAWFNPFRALHPLSKSIVAPNHITRTHPEWIRDYGGQYWLDPGEPAVREYVLRVVMDVVRRYDVDGVTFDDYFYPYPVKNALGRKLDYPDDASWQKYGLRSGLTRNDWRRQNVNQFVQSVYQSIKAAKPWVKFGISPFGIWRPGVAPGINQGAGRLREPLRRLAPVARQRLARLFCAAALLAGGLAAAKFSRPAQLVGGAKRERPPSLARTGRCQRRQRMGGGRNRAADGNRAPTINRRRNSFPPA